LVFVLRKVDSKWLSPDQVIRKELKGPGNLTCPLDVVEGSTGEELFVKVVDGENSKEEFPMRWSVLSNAAPLNAEQMRLREKLQGWTKKITPGAQIGLKDSKKRETTGALGFFAKTRNQKLGFVTNQHIADHKKNVLYFPWFGSRPCGIVKHMVEFVSARGRLNNLIRDPNALYVADCAFAALHGDIGKDDIDVRLPIIDRSGNISMKPIGKPIDLNFDTMGLLGRKVMSVGPQRSFQRGAIHGFAYEVQRENSRRLYTDYLIVGENNKDFTIGGDSGKLIVTDDEELHPVALLYGGRRQTLRPA
jgi:hypothetical protein